MTNQEVNGAQVANMFFYGDEFQNLHLDNYEFTNRLYRTFFNREPDEEGKRFWLDDLTYMQ